MCFIDSLGSGGAQRRFGNLGVLFQKAGHEVSFLTYSEGDFFRKPLSEAGIPITRITARSKLLRLVKILRFLRSFDGDLVISVTETPNFLACLAKGRKQRWRLITTESSAKAATFRSLKRKAANALERRSDIKVCNSENGRRMWAAYYPGYAKKLRVIYNPQCVPEALTRGKTGTGPVRRLVVAASYQRLKNIDGLIEAVHRLPGVIRDRLRIDWYGRKEATKGDERIYREAAEKLSRYGIEQNIQLHSETTDIYRKMAAADAVGLFSTVEGLPNAVCEGMALGKPIIMSRVSDYEMLVKGNGILCDPDEPASIAEAISKFVEASDQELCEMGERSRQLASCLFDPAEIRNQWIKIMKATKWGERDEPDCRADQIVFYGKRGRFGGG
nr:glycosyltransferase family 4 protein [Eubacterium sp. 1001713B170207_170306_E7]